MAKLKRLAASGKPIERAPVTHEQRNHYVEVTAYYIAERRDFLGDPNEDWAQAELEIDRLLAEGQLNQ